jgi:hypothetical protein
MIARAQVGVSPQVVERLVEGRAASASAVSGRVLGSRRERITAMNTPAATAKRTEDDRELVPAELRERDPALWWCCSWFCPGFRRSVTSPQADGDADGVGGADADDQQLETEDEEVETNMRQACSASSSASSRLAGG